MMYRLENWCTRSKANPYLPPESQPIYLIGEVYDHLLKMLMAIELQLTLVQYIY